MLRKIKNGLFEKRFHSLEKIQKREEILQNKKANISRNLLLKTVLSFLLLLLFASIGIYCLFYNFHILLISLVNCLLNILNALYFELLLNHKDKVKMYLEKKWNDELMDLNVLKEKLERKEVKCMDQDLSQKQDAEQPMGVEIDDTYMSFCGSEKILLEKYCFWLMCEKRSRLIDQRKKQNQLDNSRLLDDFSNPSFSCDESRKRKL